VAGPNTSRNNGRLAAADWGPFRYTLQALAGCRVWFLCEAHGEVMRREHTKSTCVDCWFSAILAAILFTLVFTHPVLEFWTQLALSTLVLAGLAVLFDGPTLRRLLRERTLSTAGSVAGGLASAAVLYGIFLAGKWTVGAVLPSGETWIKSVYELGDGVARWRVALLLLAIVGPCEELFWRGYVQRRLTAAYGRTGVVLTICAYAGVHLAVGNPVLILAAVVCGTVWGVQYYLARDILLNALSHGVWAAIIFAVFPVV